MSYSDKPYSDKQLSNKKKIFNYRLSSARQSIESIYGIYTNKFEIFHKTLCVLPKIADIIVTACTISLWLKKKKVEKKLIAKKLT